MENNIEIWRPIIGFEGYYDISNIGRVRSWINSRWVVQSESHFLTPRMQYQRYLFTSFREKNYTIHRLVAKAFVENPNNYKIVNHKDGNKMNNNHWNLEWCTSFHNNWHAKRMGLARVSVGMERKKSSLTDDDVRYIFSKQESAISLAERYNINRSAIYAIWLGRSWNHITGLSCTRKKKHEALTF